MIGTVLSKHGVSIRLTDERWLHIVSRHPEMAGQRDQVLTTVANPSNVFEGGEGERLAVREVEQGKTLVVVYRESSPDGFVVTAFLTRRIKSLIHRKQLWP